MCCLNDLLTGSLRSCEATVPIGVVAALCQPEEIGGPMGPMSAAPEPPRTRHVYISRNRRAVLRGHTLELELALSVLPDRVWLDAFLQSDTIPSPIIGVNTLLRPRIIDGKIHWTIEENDLVAAWAYLTSCVDRANGLPSLTRDHHDGRTAAVKPTTHN